MSSSPRSSRQAGRLSGVSLLGAVVLGLALGAATAPAQASEVVKLARLLLTGKRAPSPPPTTPQPAPTERGTAAGDTTGAPQSRAAEVAPEVHAMTQRRGGEGVTLVE